MIVFVLVLCFAAGYAPARPVTGCSARRLRLPNTERPRIIEMTTPIADALWLHP